MMISRLTLPKSKKLLSNGFGGTVTLLSVLSLPLCSTWKQHIPSSPMSAPNRETVILHELASVNSKLDAECAKAAPEQNEKMMDRWLQYKLNLIDKLASAAGTAPPPTGPELHIDDSVDDRAKAESLFEAFRSMYGQDRTEADDTSSNSSSDTEVDDAKTNSDTQWLKRLDPNGWLSQLLSPELVKFYGFNGDVKRCLVMGKTQRTARTVHIFPATTSHNFFISHGLSDKDLDSPRIFLRLHPEVCDAFEANGLMIVLGEFHKLVVQVLDPALMKQRIPGCWNKYKQRLFTFSDIHLRPLQFANENLPCRRLLAAHALQALQHAVDQGWMGSDALPANEARVKELALLSPNPFRKKPRPVSPTSPAFSATASGLGSNCIITEEDEEHMLPSAFDLPLAFSMSSASQSRSLSPSMSSSSSRQKFDD